MPFYVSTRGLTTGPIPYGTIIFDMEFDFTDHVLRIKTSGGSTRVISLQNISVAEFYKSVVSQLSDFGIDVIICAVPYDIPAVSTEPFATDQTHESYDKDFVNQMWQTLVQVDSIFQLFRGGFMGKSTIVHLFWHHFDLALTRFSG